MSKRSERKKARSEAYHEHIKSLLDQHPVHVAHQPGQQTFEDALTAQDLVAYESRRRVTKRGHRRRKIGS